MAEINKRVKIGASVFPGWKDNAAGSQHGVGGQAWAANDTLHDIYIGNTALFPDRKPAAKFGGYYDEGSQTVINTIIEDAAGTIDFFAIDWYCDPATQTKYLDHFVNLFRTSPKKSLMQYCINWINDTDIMSGGYTQAQFEWAMGQIITHFADSAYLLHNGVPVFILYDIAIFGAAAGYCWKNFAGAMFKAEWATGASYAVNDYVVRDDKLYKCLIVHTAGTFATDLAANKWVAVSSTLTNVDYGAGLKHITDRIRAMTVAAGYAGVHLVGCSLGTPLETSQYGIATLGGLDAITAYNYQAGYKDYTTDASGGSATPVADRFGLVTSGGAPDYAEMDYTYRLNWHNLLNLASQQIKVWIAVLNGWDNRPWTPPANRYPVDQSPLAKHNGNCRPTWAQWRNHLIAARKAAENTARTDGFVLVYALNEHAEGGFLLSTEQDGRSALAIIDQVFKPRVVPLGTDKVKENSYIY